MSESRGPTAAVGVVCLRGGEALLIRRGAPPFLGFWSLPGGRIHFGETARAAALRELREETGVEAALGPLLDVIDIIAEGRHFLAVDFVAHWLGGEPRAGDDALEAAFFPLEALPSPMWPETVRVVRMARAHLSPPAQTA